MLIDWHTNLWLPDHVREDARAEMGRCTGGQIDASRAACRAHIGAKTDGNILLGLHVARFGSRVPDDRAIDNQGPGVSMPKLPPAIIEDIATNRPLSLLLAEG